MKNQSIGIDIGGTNISIGAVDKFGGILQQWSMKMKDPKQALFDA